ncbi:MAG: HesA/MoeB/ThiF family protein [Candidatus Methylopumilus sp.]|nr:HesA/MoeB/ThiF family protein [Candidatus Methylopumilus sp.]
MDDQQLLRYSRHILLPDIEYQGQEKLLKSHILIVGAGGLGSPITIYCAAAGIGKITICDFDNVDLTNLQRQIIHDTQSVGLNKASSAKQFVDSLNPDVEVIAVTEKQTEKSMKEIAKNVDVIIDGSDNFATRYAINRIAVELKKPLVSGAAVGFEGQVSVFDMRHDTSPCYHCLFPDTGDRNETRCADNGVFSGTVGMIGTAQAAEVMKLILGIGQSLEGRLLLLDVKSMQWKNINLKKDLACPVCSK